MEIRTRHEKLEAIYRTSIQHAWRIGQLLKVVKKRVGYGQLERWVQANCSFSPQTARVYMGVARYTLQQLDEMAKRQPAGVLTLRVFLRLTRKSSSGSPGRGFSAERTPEPSRPAVPPGSARFPESEDADFASLARTAESVAGADMAVVNGAPAAKGSCPAIPDAGVDHRRKKQSTEAERREAQRLAGEAQDAESHLSDTQWVENLPLYRQLNDPSRFAADALLWRRSQPLAIQLKPGLRQDDLGVSLLMPPQSWPFSVVAAYFAGVEHPREWQACTYIDPMGTGSHADCPFCHGTGYRLVRPYDELGCPIKSESAEG